MAWVVPATAAAALFYFYVRKVCDRGEDKDDDEPKSTSVTPVPRRPLSVYLPPHLKAKVEQGTQFHEGANAHYLCVTCNDSAPSEAAMRKALHEIKCVPHRFFLSGVREPCVFVHMPSSGLTDLLALPWVETVRMSAGASASFPVALGRGINATVTGTTASDSVFTTKRT